jgi:hypothetical protein
VISNSIHIAELGGGEEGLAEGGEGEFLGKVVA